MRRVRPLAAAVLLAVACGGRDASAPRILELSDLQARVHATRDKALLVVFWATWCDPCVEEIPDLVELHAHRSMELEILGVSLDAFLNTTEKSMQLVQEQLQRTPTPYENVLFVGAQDPLFDSFDMPGGIPYALLYDRNGQILERFPGRVKLDVVEAALAALAAGGAGS
ncbi:MAG: TlpA family protein disulfide reductase [Candidatus Latescibacterota bacterium]|nr:MAG: TlpA family protein disulfide reductase [Candidatus Latescibacterota bacterium]